MTHFIWFMLVYFAIEAIVAFTRSGKFSIIPGSKARDQTISKFIEGLIYIGFVVWAASALGLFN